MMRDEAIAATNIQNLECVGNDSRDLQCHVVSTTHFAAATLAPEPAQETGEYAGASFSNGTIKQCSVPRQRVISKW